ncbi:MAG: hypothetical protein NT169_28305 [Chloroflexi bacterium]|nr:hypothetical protein [Chloroflexota bacterium]
MTLENWRDLAVVLLALEAFVLSLIPAALLYLAVRGMTWALKQLRALAFKGQGYFRKAAQVTDLISRRVAAPIIAVNTASAQFNRWFSFLSPHIKSEV